MAKNYKENFQIISINIDGDNIIYKYKKCIFLLGKNDILILDLENRKYVSFDCDGKSEEQYKWTEFVTDNINCKVNIWGCINIEYLNEVYEFIYNFEDKKDHKWKN